MNLSLNNLAMFIKIADTGSFSAAARSMGKAQSAVSTAVANLEIDLGVELFNRKGKFPVLTREGKVLLREARQIANGCQVFMERARSFEDGVDATLRIAVDEIISHKLLMDLLEKFGEKFPATELELLYGVMSDIQTMVTQGRAISASWFPAISRPDHALQLVSHIAFIPVAAADHPWPAKKSDTL